MAISFSYLRYTYTKSSPALRQESFFARSSNARVFASYFDIVSHLGVLTVKQKLDKRVQIWSIGDIPIYQSRGFELLY
jgi:hypothetical protein